MYATARDVTEEARAAQELREAKEVLETRVGRTHRASSRGPTTSLRKSERRFRALVEHGSDSFALVDAGNRIRYLSPAVSHRWRATRTRRVDRASPTLEHTQPRRYPWSVERHAKTHREPRQAGPRDLATAP